jgi:hypothetical protein
MKTIGTPQEELPGMSKLACPSGKAPGVNPEYLATGPREVRLAASYFGLTPAALQVCPAGVRPIATFYGLTPAAFQKKLEAEPSVGT